MKNFAYCQDDQILENVPQVCCGVLILGDDPAGHCSGQLVTLLEQQGWTR